MNISHPQNLHTVVRISNNNNNNNNNNIILQPSKILRICLQGHIIKIGRIIIICIGTIISPQNTSNKCTTITITIVITIKEHNETLVHMNSNKSEPPFKLKPDSIHSILCFSAPLTQHLQMEIRFCYYEGEIVRVIHKSLVRQITTEETQKIISLSEQISSNF